MNGQKVASIILGTTAATLAFGFSMMLGIPKIVDKIMFRPLKESFPIEFDKLIDVEIPQKDGKTIHAILCPFQNKKYDPSAPILIYAHGNMGNVSTRQSFIITLAFELQINVLAFDYRGYGKSHSEKPTENKSYQDLSSVHAWALSTRNPRSVVFWGESIGCAVMIGYLAKMCPKIKFPSRVILNAPFTSMHDMARKFVPFAFTPLTYWVEAFQSLENAKAIAKKVDLEKDIKFYVVHSPTDEVVPFHQGVQIALTLNTTVKPLTGGHNDLNFEYEDIKNFIFSGLKSAAE